MKTPSLTGRVTPGTRFGGWLGVAVMVAALMLGGSAASAAPAPLSPDEQQCLTCHAVPGLDKPLDNGKTLSLHVDGPLFAKSVHSTIGCTACHTDIDRSKHPSAVKSIGSRREFSLEMSDTCRNCHSEEYKQWKQSVHAALVADGNPVAPTCVDCHSPHGVIKGAAANMDTVPCKTCHGAIFKAYAASVHGQLRAQGLTQAPLCFSCHGAHDVAVPSAGHGRRDVCLGCHTEALASHRTWLPNVDLHFSVVSCPVCHAPKAQRRVDLVLYNTTTRKEARQPSGIPQFETQNGPHGKGHPGVDPTALLTLLKISDGVNGKTGIRGRLEVSTGVEDHELTMASQAIGTCSTCHRRGAATFQSVVVSFAGPAGIPIHYDANSEVLHSALTIDSVGGFYAIGGTRLTFLDALLGLALVGGIGGPMVHMAWRWSFRRMLDRRHRNGKG